MRKKGGRLLIIDPDAGFREELSGMLVHEGYEVETADQLRWALRRIREIPFDCVVMNLDLPGVKAYEAVPLVRAQDSSVKVIICADQNTKELEARVRGQDVYYYHIKSFGVDELKLAVQGALGKAA